LLLNVFISQAVLSSPGFCPPGAAISLALSVAFTAASRIHGGQKNTGPGFLSALRNISANFRSMKAEC